MTSSTTFSGFSKELPSFFRDLEAHNNTAWLNAHRKEYETLVVEPAKQFVTALADELDAISPAIRAVPTFNGSIMRMNRDIRFSADKSPYKTALHFRFWEGKDKKSSPSFMMRLGSEKLGIAAGLYGFTPEQLKRYRNAAVEPASGTVLRRIVNRAMEREQFAPPEPHYKRVPRDFDPEHENADLLRQASLFLGRDRPIPEEMFDRGAAKYLVRQFKQLAPLHRWLLENIA